ncbi:response regulator [Sphingobacterium sp.]|uniref:response regulator n=1 Tax=Sphingobacterium sp. TaxID=341027 RepID=UPI0031D9F38B
MKKIFIVDDDPVVTAMLSKILKDLGVIDISIFSDGESCLDQLEEKPDIIFLDYQMEKMNGLEVLQELRKITSESAVVFTTALEDLSVAMQSIAQGSIEFLLKKNISKKEVQKILSEIDS